MQVTVQCVPSRLSKEYGSALAGIRTLNESAVASRCSFTFGGSSRRRSVWQQTWIFTCQSLSYLCIYRCHYLVHTLSFFQNVRESISPSTTICEMGTKSWKWGGFIQQWIHWLFTSRHDRLSKDHEFVSVLLIHSGEKECVSYGLLQSLMFAKVHDDLDCISQRSQIVGLDLLLLGLYKSQCDHHLILKNLLTFMSLSWSVSHVALSRAHFDPVFLMWLALSTGFRSRLERLRYGHLSADKNHLQKIARAISLQKVLLAKLHWSDNLIHVLPYDLKLDLKYTVKN